MKHNESQIGRFTAVTNHSRRGVSMTNVHDDPTGPVRRRSHDDAPIDAPARSAAWPPSPSVAAAGSSSAGWRRWPWPPLCRPRSPATSPPTTPRRARTPARPRTCWSTASRVPVRRHRRRRGSRRGGRRPTPRCERRSPGLLADSRRSPHVAAVEDPYAAPGAISADGRTLLAHIRLDVTNPVDMPIADTERLIETAAEAEQPGLEVRSGRTDASSWPNKARSAPKGSAWPRPRSSCC